jgi:hypothetical protein
MGLLSKLWKGVKKTVKKITKETGNKPTQQAVALFTNLSLRTVKRYWIT